MVNNNSKTDISQPFKDAGFVYREITEEMKNHAKYKLALELCKETTMVTSIPKPDFSHINEVKVSVDETPKVTQGLIECDDSDLEDEK